MGTGIASNPIGILYNVADFYRRDPFSLAYGMEAVIPANLEVPSFRHENYNEEANKIALAAKKDPLEEKREKARLQLALYQ